MLDNPLGTHCDDKNNLLAGKVIKLPLNLPERQVCFFCNSEQSVPKRKVFTKWELVAKEAVKKFILEPNVEPSNNINFLEASFVLLRVVYNLCTILGNKLLFISCFTP